MESNYEQLVKKLRILQTKNSLSYYKRQVCKNAADAIEELQAKADYWLGQAQGEYEKRLRQLPKRGEWIHDVAVHGTTAGGVTFYHGYTCSVCGALMGRKGDAYCYNCGAKMEVQE